MRNDLLKRLVGITCGVFLLLAGGSASAQTSSASQSSTQSLGDAARAARKNKPQSDTATRVYDNDNLPTTETLSVVGPDPSTQASSGQPATAQQSSATADTAAAEQRKKAADDIQAKLDAQKTKIDQLAHELDLDQREYRLKAAALYNDAGNRLRNAGEFDKEGAQYRADMDSKQKSLDDAKAQLADLQEEARKAGVREKENTGTPRDAPKENTDDKGNDKDKDK
jgi:hypothetical protein